MRPCSSACPTCRRGGTARVVDALAAACGRTVLDVHVDPDHHRSVLTLAGEPAWPTPPSPCASRRCGHRPAPPRRRAPAARCRRRRALRGARRLRTGRRRRRRPGVRPTAGRGARRTDVPLRRGRSAGAIPARGAARRLHPAGSPTTDRPPPPHLRRHRGRRPSPARGRELRAGRHRPRPGPGHRPAVRERDGGLAGVRALGVGAGVAGPGPGVDEPGGAGTHRPRGGLRRRVRAAQARGDDVVEVELVGLVPADRSGPEQRRIPVVGRTRRCPDDRGAAGRPGRSGAAGDATKRTGPS